LKKQTIPKLKKKFLNFLVECPVFTSNIYDYKISGEGTKFIKNEGIIVINIFGIFLYEKNKFKKAKIHINLEEVQNLEIHETSVSIEYIDDFLQQVKHLQIKSPMKNDIAYDIVSYMLVAMREHKRLYYSYNFLSKFVAQGRSLSSVNDDPVTQAQVTKCLEEISSLKEYVLNSKNLAFDKRYNECIPEQNADRVSQITLGKGFSIQSQKSFKQTLDLLRIKGELN
jgi:hypothetical protein